MRHFLAFVPYLASLSLYYYNYRRTFVPVHNEEPVGWLWQMLQPVLLTAFAPMLLVSRSGLSGAHILWLVVAPLFTISFVVVAGTLLSQGEYMLTQEGLGTAARVFPWLTSARLLLAVGFVCILGCGVVTAWASS